MANPTKKQAAQAPKAAQPVQAAPAQPAPVKMDFDAWWAMNEKKIPSQHRKEIILADFKARKLTLRETRASYDQALVLYGVKAK